MPFPNLGFRWQHRKLMSALVKDLICIFSRQLFPQEETDQRYPAFMVRYSWLSWRATSPKNTFLFPNPVGNSLESIHLVPIPNNQTLVGSLGSFQPNSDAIVPPKYNSPAVEIRDYKKVSQSFPRTTHATQARTNPLLVSRSVLFANHQSPWLWSVSPLHGQAPSEPLEPTKTGSWTF